MRTREEKRAYAKRYQQENREKTLEYARKGGKRYRQRHAVARKQAQALGEEGATAKEIERFRTKVGPADANGCCVYLGATDGSGRGVFGIGPQILVKAHRLAYFIAYGPIGDKHVLHRCDNPPCCNPAHLFLGTHTDNMRDMHAKGRAAPCPWPKGERQWKAKLTVVKAAQIRGLLWSSRLLQKEIAEMFDVRQTTISRIKRGKHWRVAVT